MNLYYPEEIKMTDIMKRFDRLEKKLDLLLPYAQEICRECGNALRVKDSRRIGATRVRRYHDCACGWVPVNENGSKKFTYPEN